MRYFEKISFDQFKKDISSDLNLYNEYTLPRRDTEFAAGYDFNLYLIIQLNQKKKKKYQLELRLIWKVTKYYF